MKALITGGAGFIGSHLTELLLEQRHAVTVVDDLSTGSLENLQGASAQPQFEFVLDTVCDEATMTALISGCDVIFHLAAAVGVQLIVDRPVHTLETNIHGSEVVLNLANKFRKPILLASTSEVYGKSTKVPFAEDDDVTLGSTRYTRWSYACSKMVDEFLALAYHDHYGLPTIVVRLFNTIGPRQTGQYGMVAPRFIERALAGETLEVYGTGEQIRCFCNVTDVVDALVKLVSSPQAVGQVVNVGATESITIEHLADKVIERSASTSDKRHVSYEEAYGRPFDDMLIRVPDLTKVQGLIGYEPKYSLDETLDQMIEHEKRRGE